MLYDEILIKLLLLALVHDLHHRRPILVTRVLAGEHDNVIIRLRRHVAGQRKGRHQDPKLDLALGVHVRHVFQQ